VLFFFLIVAKSQKKSGCFLQHKSQNFKLEIFQTHILLTMSFVGDASSREGDMDGEDHVTEEEAETRSGQREENVCEELGEDEAACTGRLHDPAPLTKTVVLYEVRIDRGREGYYMIV
jgi:hypothetical protein